MVTFAKKGKDLKKAKELFTLIILSKRVAKYIKLINKRIIKKMGAFSIKYNI